MSASNAHAGGRATRQRERLKAAHRRTACRLEVIFDGPSGVSGYLLSANNRTTVRRSVSRLANLVGVERNELSLSDTYTRHVRALRPAGARRGRTQGATLGRVRPVLD